MVREGRTGLGVITAGVAFLLPVAYSPAVEYGFWSPKAALIPLIAGGGLAFLFGAPRRELAAATWAARAFLAVAAVSTVLAVRPGLALYGRLGFGTGAVFVFGLAGAWAIGCHLAPDDVRLLRKALLAAIGINVAIAIGEMAFDLRALGLARFEGRAGALLTNPIYLAPLLAGVLVLVPLPAVTWRAARQWAVPLGAIVAVGIAMSLAGSRTALVLVVGIVAWIGVRRSPAAAGLMLAAVMAGWLAGPLVDRPPPAKSSIADDFNRNASAPTTSAPAAAPAGSDATGLAATISPNRRPLRPRLETWASAGPSVLRRPLFGAGPGQFATATIHERPRYLETDVPGGYFLDAHNLLVEYAVTTGMVGLGALLAWLGLALRRARGDLAAFAVVLLVAHLVEPLNVAVTPLAFLALGAATVGSGESTSPVRGRRLLVASCGAGAGVLAGAVFLVGCFDLRQAGLDFRLAPARRADAILRPWSAPPTLIARIYTFRGTFRAGPDVEVTEAGRAARAADREARRWYWRAVQRDPSSVPAWVRLADFEYSHGMIRSARAHYLRALDLNRWSAAASIGLANVLRQEGDIAGARRWYDAAHALDGSLPSADQVLTGSGR